MSTTDLAMMNIGDALDFVYSWIESKEGTDGGTRMATQEDIDRFLM